MIFSWGSKVEGIEFVQSHGFDRDVDQVFVAGAFTPVLLTEEIAACFQHSFQGKKTNDFRAGGAEAAFESTFLTSFKSFVKGSDGNIRQVHRDLSNAIFFHIPADAFDRFQGARLTNCIAILVYYFLTIGRAIDSFDPAFFPNIEGDGIGTADRLGVEVDIVSNEEIPHANGCLASFGIESLGSKIRFPFGATDFLGESFVFAGPKDGEVAAVVGRSCFFVEVNGNPQFISNPLTQLLGVGDTLVKSDTGNGDERANIGRAHPRVGTSVLAHIDQLAGFADGPESSFHHGFRFTNNGDHSTVGRGTRINVQEGCAFNRFDLGGNLLDDGHVPAFRKIGDTFDQFFHSSYKFAFT